ncbi:iron complex transport system permease protein [Enteractinococcus coprophilus]|uniref:Iron complex transport system permease protein n=1 Tax=Enteractinococcus coprophilus TaxID=1027633 RepID=A0A543AP21_9MICC|nr:iron complex transport system permease protein [Enteractinococcus coprophilus]
MDLAVLGVQNQRRRTYLWLVLLTVATAASLVLGISIGAVAVSPADVLGVIGHRLFGLADGSWSETTEAIVWDVRLPRVVLGLCVGAGLAVCGMALQAMVRNMLADPYLLGINSGASSGAAAAILFGFGAGLGEHALQGSAFLGALAASLLVYSVARTGGRVTSVRLLLAGVTVGYALYALTSFLIFASGSAEGARSVMFWLLGSLSLATWGTPLLAVVLSTLLTITVLTMLGRSVDVLALGDETSLTLGISPEKLRTGLLVLVALCIGILVSAAGSIGFVGLVVPHLARRAVGSTHSRAIPVAALMGGVLLIWADLVARTMLAPQEIPVGILTAMVGAPFLLILIHRLQAAN